MTSQSCPARAKAQARSLGPPRTPSTSQGCPHTCERRSSSLRPMKRAPRRDGRTPGGIPGSFAAHTCEPCLMQVRAILGIRPGWRAQGAAVRSDGSTAAPVPDAARPEREAPSGRDVGALAGAGQAARGRPLPAPHRRRCGRRRGDGSARAAGQGGNPNPSPRPSPSPSPSPNPGPSPSPSRSRCSPPRRAGRWRHG